MNMLPSRADPGPIADLPRHRGQQVVPGNDRLVPGVHQHEATRAIRVLGHARLRANLTEQGGVLISRNARNGNAAAQQSGLTQDLAGRTDLRQERFRNIENLQQLRIPAARLDVAEHRAGGVGRIGDMNPSLGQFPDQPGVDRAKRKAAAPGKGAGPFDVLEDPSELGSGEVGVHDQAGPAANRSDEFVRLELIAHSCRATVLPDDRVADRLSGLAIPDEGRLALVRDANARDLDRLRAGQPNRLAGHGKLGGPDRLGIMLNPPRLGKQLRELLLRDGDNRSGSIKQDGARTGRPLIEGENILLRG